MFFPDVLQRWRGSANDAATVVDGIAGACPPAATSLLEELAVDSEDFSDIAAVLRVDLRAVIGTLLLAHPQTARELVEQLTTARAAEDGSPAVATVSAAAAAEGRPSWCGGEEAGGWGRWTRVHRGARVHRDAGGRKPATAPRPAMATP